MDINEMQYVITIIQEGTLTKAAERLYLTQPTLTRTIMKLENKLGTPLFNKTKIPWTLTYAGGLFVKKAKQILDLENKFLKDISDICNFKKGLLTIGLMYFEEKALMPEILPVFYEHFPSIQVELLHNSSIGLEEFVLNDTVDIGILVLPLTYSGIECIPIKTYNIILALPVNHPLAKNYVYPENNKDFPLLDLSLLKDYPFILLKKGRPLREITIELCKKAGFVPRVALEAHNFDTVHSFVVAGQGASLLLDQTVTFYNAQEKVAYFKIEGNELTQTIAFAYREGKKLSELEQTFLDILQEC